MGKLLERKVLIAWLVVAFVVCLMIIGFFVLRGDRTNLEYKDHHYLFNSDWVSVSADGEETPISLPANVNTGTDEAFVLRHVLPDDIKENDAIISRNYHQILEVRIDGELVFAYPMENWSGIGNVISDEWCLIPLSPSDSGKTIEFSYINSAIFRFTAYVGEFYIGNDNSLVQYVRGVGFPGVVIGIIICVIGGLALIVSFVYRKHTNQSPNTAMGMALLCFGIWITNRAKMCLFPEHSVYVYWASIIALMLVAPFVFLYSYYRNTEFKRTALWCFRLCIIADIFLILSSFFIRYDIEVICIFAYGLSVLALALNAYSLFLGGFGKASKRKSSIERLLDRTEFVSNLIFPIFGGLEMIFFHHLLWTDASNYLRMGILFFAVCYMIFVLWRTFLVVQDRTEVTKQLHDSQLELMMGQIQPHFIFNTLSSIRALVMVDPKLSYDMLYDFSNYLRANIDNVTNLDGIAFAAEVSHIKSYVNIEKVRFGDRLNVEYDIKSESFTVPPLSIQPLVENAIKHGVCKKPDGGTVTLKSYEEEKYHVVEVNDDGVGFNSQTAARVFSEFNSTGPSTSQADQTTRKLMKDVMDHLSLLDADGTPITIGPSSPIVNLSGNGSEQHQSTGMLNILLRLREISNARVEISSQENVGTNIKVLFPKEDEIK